MRQQGHSKWPLNSTICNPRGDRDESCMGYPCATRADGRGRLRRCDGVPVFGLVRRRESRGAEPGADDHSRPQPPRFRPPTRRYRKGRGDGCRRLDRATTTPGEHRRSGRRRAPGRLHLPGDGARGADRGLRPGRATRRPASGDGLREAAVGGFPCGRGIRTGPQRAHTDLPGGPTGSHGRPTG